MSERDDLIALGVDVSDDGPQSGICSEKWLRDNKIVRLSSNQLKNYSQMLNQRAAALTREEIEREVAINGDKISAAPLEEIENARKAQELQKHQQEALAEKRRQYEAWEKAQKK